MQSTHAVIYLLYTFFFLFNFFFISINNVSWNKQKNNKNVIKVPESLQQQPQYNSLFHRIFKRMDCCILYFCRCTETVSLSLHFKAWDFYSLFHRPMVSLEIVSQFYARWIDITVATFIYTFYSEVPIKILYCISFARLFYFVIN